MRSCSGDTHGLGWSSVFPELRDTGGSARSGRCDHGEGKRTKLVAGGCLAEGCIYPLAARVLSKPPGTTRALAADCLGCSWADQLVDPCHSGGRLSPSLPASRVCASTCEPRTNHARSCVGAKAGKKRMRKKSYFRCDTALFLTIFIFESQIDRMQVRGRRNAFVQTDLSAFFFFFLFCAQSSVTPSRA